MKGGRNIGTDRQCQSVMDSQKSLDEGTEEKRPCFFCIVSIHCRVHRLNGC